LVLFGVRNRMFGPHWAAVHGILIPMMDRAFRSWPLPAKEGGSLTSVRIVPAPQVSPSASASQQQDDMSAPVSGSAFVEGAAAGEASSERQAPATPSTSQDLAAPMEQDAEGAAVPQSKGRRSRCVRCLSFLPPARPGVGGLQLETTISGTLVSRCAVATAGCWESIVVPYTFG
jgi:hypothetical protein